MRRALVAALIAGTSACDCSAPRPDEERPLDIEYAGCASVLRGPRCLLDPEHRALVLWSALPAHTALRVEVDGEPLESSHAFVEGGVQIRVEMPIDARELSIRSADGRRFRLPLGERESSDALHAASEARARGELDEAARRLAPLVDGADEMLRARALSLLARLAFSSGETERAIARLEESAAELERLGDLSSAVADRQMAAMLSMHELWRFEDAGAALDRADAIAGNLPEAAARNLYYRGRLAMQVADLLAAASYLERARVEATRLGVDVLLHNASQQRAIVLQQLGRHEEALASLDAMEGDATAEAGCGRADYLTSVGWARLIARDDATASLRAVAEDPLPPLRVALREYERSCPRAVDLGNAQVNLALAELLRGRTAAARGHLETAQTHIPRESATLRSWTLEVDARASLAAGDAESALASWSELASRARAVADTSFEWRATYGRARALRALGRAEDALSALREAEVLVDERVLAVTLGDGRAAFAGEHERSARALVELLVALGRDDDALETARHARQRALRSLHRTERVRDLPPAQQSRWVRALESYWALRRSIDEETADAWRVPLDEAAALAARVEDRRAQLRRRLDDAMALLERGSDVGSRTSARAAPGENEIVFTYFPGEDGWVAFASTAEGISARRNLALTPQSPPAILAAQLLEPFASILREARRVRIVAYGWLDRVDFHELPLGSGRLSDTHAVVYGVDLGPAPVGSRPHRALVVADPRGDLESAAVEGRTVAALLTEHDYPTQLLVGEQARAESLARALRGVSVFHYAGHGRFGGRGGWQSALPLAGQHELSVGDVLMLPEVPREVVLSACEGGRSDDVRSGVVGLSIARAFVAAGSSSVLAAVRPVDDRAASELAAAYYARRLAADDTDPGDALRLAVESLMERRPGSDWSSYRVFVP